jgi:hypothetical protein
MHGGSEVLLSLIQLFDCFHESSLSLYSHFFQLSNLSPLHAKHLLQHHIVTRSDYRQDFGLEIGFIDHLNTRLVTTLNYTTVVDFHALQITTAHAKSLQSALVSTSRSLVTASNNGDSSASVLKSSLNGGSLPAELASKCVSVITSQLRPTESTALLLLLRLFPWDCVLFVKVSLSNSSGIFAYLISIA